QRCVDEKHQVVAVREVQAKVDEQQRPQRKQTPRRSERFVARADDIAAEEWDHAVRDGEEDRQQQSERAELDGKNRALPRGAEYEGEEAGEPDESQTQRGE